MVFDYRITTKLGKQTLGGHKQNFVHTRTKEPGSLQPIRLQSQTLLSIAQHRINQDYKEEGLGEAIGVK